MNAAFDEMKGHDGGVRPAYDEISRWLKEIPPDVLDYRRREAELLFRRIGITFAVYGEADAQERLIPFDVIPRIMSGTEWRLLEKGLTQRVKALNLFLKDIYGAREILRAGGELSGRIARHAQISGAGGGRARPDGGAAHARRLQLGLLRALVPGRQARRRTGRRSRPVREGRVRLHAHHARPAPGRRDLPAHRRRLHRSAHLPPR